MRDELAEWAQQAHDLSLRRAAGLIPVVIPEDRATFRFEHLANRWITARAVEGTAGSRVPGIQP